MLLFFFKKINAYVLEAYSMQQNVRTAYNLHAIAYSPMIYEQTFWHIFLLLFLPCIGFPGKNVNLYSINIAENIKFVT